MRKLLLLGVIQLFFLGNYAQQPETPREIWCFLTHLEVKNAKEFQHGCNLVLSIFPSATEVNKLDIHRKLYLNKMRGVLKRGSSWVTLAPAHRVDLAESALKYTNDFIKWEEGMRNGRPSFAQRNDIIGTEECLARELKYKSLGEYSRDVNYVYVDCIDSPNKRVEEKFWCVLEFLVAMVECDQAYATFE
ncbi:MAG: hypothetical protein H6581_03500 [Bacteroidia bacterium]|nr:hypothetical protein [Bacteroidia bacterium]